MVRRITLIAAASSFCLGVATPQEVVTYKSAVVALAEDAGLRADFEEGLAAKFRARNYDAVTSYDLVPDVADVDDADFATRLASEGIRAVLMMRPAAIGEGATLEAVRDQLSADIFTNMQTFARELSPSGGDDLLAVIHMAIYVIGDDGTELISAGAVWLDEALESREQGVQRLQDLIVTNVDGVRAAIREHLGLPPLQ